MNENAPDRAPRWIGVYFAILQLVFTLGWTLYVIYLPKLAASVGIAPASVILILMLDQAIFAVADTAMGMAADKLTPWVGRLAVVVGGLTVLSCAAFVALPFVAGAGPSAQLWFIVLIVIWAITSSALRAPPLTLIGRYAARPSLPFLSALTMLGYGLAGAAAPYLAMHLRDYDARLPFVIASAVLLIVALSLSRVEKSLRAVAPQPSTPAPSTPPQPLGTLAVVFIASALILALGFQLHFGINSAALYLRFAPASDLPWLMPIFWVGFNIALFPASVVIKHRGGLIVMGLAGTLGALGILAAEMSGTLTLLMIAQFVTGAAWGCILVSAVSAALAIGRGGAEGKVVGLVFSALALATFTRMAVVAGGLQKMPDYKALLEWAPVAFWLAAGVGIVVLAAGQWRGRVTSPAGG